MAIFNSYVKLPEGMFFQDSPIWKWFITPVKFPKGTTSRGGDSIRLAAGSAREKFSLEACDGQDLQCPQCVYSMYSIYRVFPFKTNTHTHIYIYN